MKNKWTKLALALWAVCSGLSGPARASDSDRLDALDQKVKILERKLELAEETAQEKAKTTPVVEAGKDGFLIKSPDGQFVFRLRGYVQADGRFFPGGAPALGTSTLFLRRARPITEATLWRYFGLRLMPDFGSGRVTLYDAYLDVRVLPAFGVRAGKTKPPIGLERLQSATDIRFVERGLPTNLVPNRDVGFQVLGDFAGGALSYAVGVFNGVPDIGNGDGDAANDKDLVARLFARLGGLGFGIAASTGIERGTLSAPGLASYVTPGQQVLFRYRDSTVANGRRFRVSPQAYFSTGPLGLLGEYVVSSQVVTRGVTTGQEIKHTSWQVAGSWFPTGEKASFTTVTPRRPFNPGTGAWGAVEIAARYGVIQFEDAAFPVFANTAASVQEAQAWSAGITWHFGRAVQFAVNYEATTFTSGGASGNRAPEHFFVTRLQQAF